MILDELALKYSSDKSSSFHNYTKYYNLIFNDIKDNSLNILEIGVATGASLKMWKEYFINSKIYGIDIESSCKKLEEDRIKIFIGGQDDPNFLNKTKSEIGSDLDIIIEDGSHYSVHQINSFKLTFPFLKSGGLYIVEDLHCSYIPSYRRGESIIGVNFFKSLVDELNLNGKSPSCNKEFMANKELTISQLEKENKPINYYEKYIESILFFPSMCIIKKC